ncbi:ATP-binding protein [Streptomyces rubiginosohelvolus]|uniref:ATP-binding protein n=1 Tax=Streptomyces rubiginosohelvolus TaxID=67362 RepID=UPI0036B7C8DD
MYALKQEAFTSPYALPAVDEAAGTQGREQFNGRRKQESSFGPVHLPTSAIAARQARDLVRSVLRKWDMCEFVDDALLLVSELVTNALTHSHGPLSVTMERGDSLRVTISDGSMTSPRPAVASVDDEHGRGLAMVAMVARSWGASPNGTGKDMWFELAAPEESA